ncbi:MAG: hypothetical protein AAFY65_00450 [Pseudomonadota bacterium]
MAILFLDSLAIGIVAATLTIEATILLDPNRYGLFFTDLPAWVLGLVWLQFSVILAPFGTLILLARATGD